jgi:hypothetical protein
MKCKIIKISSIKREKEKKKKIVFFFNKNIKNYNFATAIYRKIYNYAIST